MELTFIGSSADKIFGEAYKNFTLEKRFKAEIVFQNDFNLNLFDSEFNYLRELKYSQFSDAQKAMEEDDNKSALKILTSLSDETQLKLERYEIAQPIIFILQKKIT